MGELLSYSGLSTKIRAMQSRLLTEQQYRELAEIKNVPLAVAYLKQRPAYQNTWAALSEDDLHRGKIEELLVNSIYDDYTKIYRFSNMKQRKFLDLYFGRYEISIMKECLNKIFDHRDVDLDLSIFKPFFDKHSRLDVSKLTASSSIEEFVANLKGTSYYQPLQTLARLEEPTLFDYEMALDLYYFSEIWKCKDKILAKKDLEEITRAYGNKFDLLNIQWIYRSRQYYQMNTADIYALLIPVNYKLRKKEIKALVEADNSAAFESILAQTYYGKRYEKLKPGALEEMYAYIMKHVLSRDSKRDPYSVSTIYCYLYHKEHEIDRLTTVLECIRYGTSPEDTMSYIFKS
jgi:V/A-type H+-transporting ATPase subunit C